MYLEDNEELINIATYKFTFGKYKGKSAKVILSIDPQYLNWCHNVIKWFTLNPKDYQIVLDKIIAFDKLQGLTSYVEHGLEVYGNDCMY
jgi:uncharacterized protein (DUF3820 family)